MLILGFGGVLGELAAGMVCTSSTSKAVCSDFSRGDGGILILVYGCSFVVMLAPLLSSFGRVVVTGSLSLFKPTGLDYLWPGRKELVDFELAESTHRSSPLPFPEVGCPNACPWEGVCDWSPHTAVQGHKASWVHWRCRLTMFWLPPPWQTPGLDWDLSIPGICHNSEPAKHLLCEPGDRPCHCGVPGCPPRFLGCWWKVVPQGNDKEVPGSSGGGRCWGSPIKTPYPFPTSLPFWQKMHIQSSCNLCKDMRSGLLRVDSR